MPQRQKIPPLDLNVDKSYANFNPEFAYLKLTQGFPWVIFSQIDKGKKLTLLQLKLSDHKFKIQSSFWSTRANPKVQTLNPWARLTFKISWRVTWDVNEKSRWIKWNFHSHPRLTLKLEQIIHRERMEIENLTFQWKYLRILYIPNPNSNVYIQLKRRRTRLQFAHKYLA